MVEKFIKNILDIPGVDGVCFFDVSGRKIASALPDFFIDELFEDLTRRVVALYETVDDNFFPCDDYLLKYGPKWITLRRNKNLLILVLSDQGVNQVSLKMVTNLALKNIKIPPRDGGESSSSRPSVASSQPESPKAAPEPAAPPAEHGPRPPETPPSSRPAEDANASRPRSKPTRPQKKRSYRGTSY